MRTRSVEDKRTVATFPSLNFISLLKSCVAGEAGTVKHYEYPAGKWPDSRRIDFRSPFSGTPTLTYGLYFLDSYYGKNLRIDTVVTNLSRTGFQLTLRSWANTVLYGAYVSWMACGK